MKLVKCYLGAVTDKIEFHPKQSVLKYHQESSNSCCLSSLTSSFYSIGNNRAATDLKNHT